MEIRGINQEGLNDAARTFIENIGSHRVVAFYGAMGAGKTTFIKALCEELGVGEPVTSPTFAIVNEYAVEAAKPHTPVSKIYHFDFYRIKRLEEAFDIGFEDYLDSGNLCFIEWPELIEDLLPDTAVRVRIAVEADGSRVISW